ncbi:MAG: 3',5'-cyclic-nucleotide phosphodiesterase [Halofilum sp. (in: g-proteobacteria)]|nr:3',5'-cyclic-nucleotide phosphodiesterase [Halofilum sp. (in: g-proteobacteria)]
MRVHVLGCSGGIGGGLHTTAFRVDNDILIDAGTGVGNLPLAEMRDIRHVFLTHSHLDHVVGVPLLLGSIFERLVGDPLTVHALPQTIEALERHVFNDHVWPDFRRLPDPEHGVVRLVAHAPGERVEIGGRSIAPVEVRHSVPAVGYVCADAGGSFCFSGDTGSNETLWAELNRIEPVDALIVEVGFPNADAELAEQAGHYWPQAMAEDLERLEYRPPVLVTHLKPGCEDEIMGELRSALPRHMVRRLQGGESFKV